MREGWLRAGEAMAFTNAVTTAVALRLAGNEGRPGAYTPGRCSDPNSRCRRAAIHRRPRVEKGDAAKDPISARIAETGFRRAAVDRRALRLAHRIRLVHRGEYLSDLLRRMGEVGAEQDVIGRSGREQTR
jgi:hypothetical protein